MVEPALVVWQRPSLWSSLGQPPNNRPRRHPVPAHRPQPNPTIALCLLSIQARYGRKNPTEIWEK